MRSGLDSDPNSGVRGEFGARGGRNVWRSGVGRGVGAVAALRQMRLGFSSFVFFVFWADVCAGLRLVLLLGHLFVGP
ncbi:hypothetical protein V6Z12_D04G176600 [Gossypium hirsutum]